MQELRRQHHVGVPAVLAAFAVTDTDETALVVDVGQVKAGHFRNMKIRRRGRSQCGACLQARYT